MTMTMVWFGLVFFFCLTDKVGQLPTRPFGKGGPLGGARSANKSAHKARLLGPKQAESLDSKRSSAHPHIKAAPPPLPNRMMGHQLCQLLPCKLVAAVMFPFAGPATTNLRRPSGHNMAEIFDQRRPGRKGQERKR